MPFNPIVTRGLQERDRPLAEIIMFFVERGYNLYHFFPKDAKVIKLDESLYEEAQRVTLELFQNGVLIDDYPEGIVRLSPTLSLYVTEEQEVDIDIDRLRMLFPPGQKSDKITINNLLLEFFKMHPQYNMDDVERAGRAYMDHCHAEDRLVRDCNNFIKDSAGTSMLLQWLEDPVTDQTLSDDFI